MTNRGEFFEKWYQEIVSTIPQEVYNNFKNTDDDEERIRVLYNIARCIPIKTHEPGKNIEIASDRKREGNRYYATNQFVNALNTYNEGILHCPHDDAGLELLAVLVANRSAVLYELKQYQNALNDIEYVIGLDSYPSQLRCKLFMRQGKCYDNLGNCAKAVSAYQTAINKLDDANLPPHDKDTKMKELAERAASACRDLNSQLISPKVDEIMSEKYPRNSRYPSAHCLVTIQEDNKLGRYASALGYLEAGTVILEENAHCAVVAKEFTLTNCQFCLKGTRTPLPCETCAHIIFCSLDCREKARVFHTFECSFQKALLESGASINCCMALRIVSQLSLDVLLQDTPSSPPFELATIKKEQVPKCYTPDCYRYVYNLCGHANVRKKEDFFHNTIMAIYLLRLLKSTFYFGHQTDNDTLSNEEAFVGKVLLRNLQILQFNAHEISELRPLPPGPNDPKDEPNCKSVFIGGGLYPTLALFNHSCEPNIVRYNSGTKVIVRTIKPIKKGETIYENYGPLYTNHGREERQALLKDRYWFDCLCIACTGNWPLFTEMDEKTLSIPCQTKQCPCSFLMNKETEDPMLLCTLCKKSTNIFPIITKLWTIDAVLHSAEQLYKERKYEQAIKKYLSVLNVYYQTTKPPFPDLVKVQQRLRTCMVHGGNKGIEYTQVL